MNLNYMKQYQRSDYDEKLKKYKDQSISSNPDPPILTQKRRDRQILPYTFDPKTVLEDLAINSNSYNSVGSQPKEHKPLSNTPSKSPEKMAGILEQPGNLLEKTENEVNKTKQKGEDFNSQSKDWTAVYNSIEDSMECKAIDETILGDDQHEVEELSKQIIGRNEKLKSFVKELENSDPNMLFFKNRLIREIGDMQNDLKEANNNILVLLKERANMKEQMSLLNAKYKKAKNFIKGFIEDTKVYDLNVNIDEI